MKSLRYNLYRVGNQHLLLSQTTSKILDALGQVGQISYTDLQYKTKIPKNSLYVFAQRLQENKIIRRKKIVRGNPRRVHVVLVLNQSVRRIPLKVIK